MKIIPRLLTMTLLVVTPLSHAEAVTPTKKEVKQDLLQIAKINKKIVADSKKHLRKAKSALKKANRTLHKAQIKKNKADRRLAKLLAKYPNATPAQQAMIAKAQQAMVQAALTLSEAQAEIETATTLARTAADSLIDANTEVQLAAANKDDAQNINYAAVGQKKAINDALDEINNAIKEGNLAAAQAEADKLLTTVTKLQTSSATVIKAAEDLYAAQQNALQFNIDITNPEATIAFLEGQADLTSDQQAQLEAARALVNADAAKAAAEQTAREVADLVSSIIDDITSVSPS